MIGIEIPPARKRQVRIVADDLTGAMEALAEFQTADWSTELQMAPERPSAAAVVALSTNSRLEPGSVDLREFIGKDHISSDRTLIKADSAIRGLTIEALGAIKAFAPGKTLVVCPALPSAGRTVDAGVVRIHGVPVHETELALDGRRRTVHSDLPKLLGASSHLDRGQIASSELPDIMLAGGPIVVCDAVDDDDLVKISRAVAYLGPKVVPIGSAGIARSLAAEWKTTRATQPVLVFVSSAHANARDQLGCLARMGAEIITPTLEEMTGDQWPSYGRRVSQAFIESCADVFVLASPIELGSAEEGATIVRRLAELTSELLASRSCQGLALVGGEGAQQVFQRIRVQALLPRRQHGSTPVLAAVGGEHQGLLVCTKPGSAGPDDALVHMTTALATN